MYPLIINVQTVEYIENLCCGRLLFAVICFWFLIEMVYLSFSKKKKKKISKQLIIDTKNKSHTNSATNFITSASLRLLPGRLTTNAIGICPANSSGYLFYTIKGQSENIAIFFPLYTIRTFISINPILQVLILSIYWINICHKSYLLTVLKTLKFSWSTLLLIHGMLWTQ